jgi:hypothetical protein
MPGCPRKRNRPTRNHPSHAWSAPSLRTIFERNEGRRIHKCEHYFDVYERHFSMFRGRSPRILEIGVFHGVSLDMRRSYFGRGTQLVDIDINPRCADLARRNIDIRIGDQSDREFLRRVIAEDGPFDVIIEDGSHLPNTRSSRSRNSGPP